MEEARQVHHGDGEGSDGRTHPHRLLAGEMQGEEIWKEGNGVTSGRCDAGDGNGQASGVDHGGRTSSRCLMK